MRMHLLSHHQPHRLVQRLYRDRPGVGAMVLRSILACSGTLRHRWSQPNARGARR